MVLLFKNLIFFCQACTQIFVSFNLEFKLINHFFRLLIQFGKFLKYALIFSNKPFSCAFIWLSPFMFC